MALENGWKCDACFQNISNAAPRIHCRECPDVDLHASCYLDGHAPGNHSLLHDVQAVDLALGIGPSSMHHVSEDINPPRTRGRSMPNFDTDSNGRRFIRLFNSTPKHVRYMAFDVPAGKYKVTMFLGFTISPYLRGAAGALAGLNLGKLRVCVGVPKDFAQFDNRAVPENDTMVETLFLSGSIHEVPLNIPAGTPSTATVYEKKVELDGKTSSGKEVYVDVGEDERLGILIQWIGVRELHQPNEFGALLNMYIYGLRLERLFKGASVLVNPFEETINKILMVQQLEELRRQREQQQLEAAAGEILAGALLASFLLNN